MPTTYKIVMSLTALAMAYGLGAYPNRRKYNQIAHVLLAVADEKQTADNQIEYLVKLLNENGITLDEFDLIMLNNFAKDL